jgi:hypothetical protein
MDLPQLALSSWHTILTGLAVEVALENAALVALSFWTQRRWSDRVLVVVPLAAFVWLLAAARAIEAQLTWWSHYDAFLAEHYPLGMYPLLYPQIQQAYQSVVEGAARLGWTAVLMAEGMVLLGGLLVLRWGRGIWWGRRSTLMHPMPAEDEAGELEITVEPLKLEGAEVWNLFFP